MAIIISRMENVDFILLDVFFFILSELCHVHDWRRTEQKEGKEKIRTKKVFWQNEHGWKKTLN
jgi:nicotinamide riboside transporter PnuC